jgi:uncharacterized damage-inducible protein DinB
MVRDLTSNLEIRKHLSHLANCQYKWLDRLVVFPETSTRDWWTPVYDSEDLIFHFTESTHRWVIFLSQAEERKMDDEVSYVGFDGSIWQAKIKDIALQLIFHSFHHRAQIQMMIRAIGKDPEFIDYIGYKAQKKEAD